MHLARLVHGLNPLLETLRGGFGAESTVLIHPNLHTSDCCITNTGDKRFRLRALCADADRVRFVANTLVAYIDVVIASGEMRSGVSAQGSVAAAGRVAVKRRIAICCIIISSLITNERKFTTGRV